MPLDHSGVGKKKGKPSGPYSKLSNKKTYYKKKSGKGYTSKAFKQAVQSVVSKNVETKQAFTTQFSQIQNYNSSINSSGDNNFVVPNLGQGFGDNMRNGDQITGKKLTLKGHFITRFTGAAGSTYYQNCRIGVRLMLIQPKSYAGQGNISANSTTWMATLLKNGGTTKGFTGLISDLYSPINTDAITSYYDRVYFVQNPYSNAVLGSTANNLLMPVGTTKFFSKTIKLRNKVIKYDNSIDSGLTPVNYNPTLLIGYSYLDGTSGDSVTTQIGFSWVGILDYEDA